MNLKDKVAIVTGSGRGIGKAIAQKLCENGAKTVMSDIDESLLVNAVLETRKINKDVVYYRCNVANEEDVKSLVNFVMNEFGTIDILINNAGIVSVKSINELTLDEWNKTLSINLTGTFLCSKYVIEKMKLKNYGKIVNIGSLAGQSGGILVGPDYSASKGGVIAFTKALARDAASYNININAISPSTVPTPGIGNFSKDGLQKIEESIPLKRLATPEDIANLVLFIVSDESSYITGATIDINGGLLMR